MTFVSQWYPPEPMSVPEGIAHALRDQDFEVQVLTGVPNYPSGRVHDGYTATQISTETIGGMTVKRTPLYPNHGQSAIKRIANFAAWALSASILGRSFIRKGEVTLVYGSPILAALPALVVKRLHKVPYVLLVPDLWPDSVFASGFLERGVRSRIARAVLSRFCSTVYRNASSIAVSSPGMKNLLVQRGVPHEKVSLVYNWAPELALSQEADVVSLKKEFGLADAACVLLYAGNLGAAQALETAVEAIAMLPEESDCHLILMGDGVRKPELMKNVNDRNLKRIHFHPQVASTRMAAYADSCDAQLVCLADRQLFEVTMPSKMQTIMQSGVPALVSANGDVARIAVESGVGLVSRAGDAKALSVQILKLSQLGSDDLKAMGDAGRKYYFEHMSRVIGARRIAELMENAILKGSDFPSDKL